LFDAKSRSPFAGIGFPAQTSLADVGPAGSEFCCNGNLRSPNYSAIRHIAGRNERRFVDVWHGHKRMCAAFTFDFHFNVTGPGDAGAVCLEFELFCTIVQTLSFPGRMTTVFRGCV
jgi:hypothetical protein